jgi:Fe(3+) dicitrate transport protein
VLALISVTLASSRAVVAGDGGADVGAVTDAGRGEAAPSEGDNAAADADAGVPPGPVTPLVAEPVAPSVPLVPAPAPSATDAVPRRIEELTVVGTRESRTAGSAHVLRPRDLERMNYDNPETVTRLVTGVYARGEDGFGLRPNIGIRGTSPDRSKKVTLMEDGILFAPAPYAAPAAYFFPLITRMELVRVVKGPGAVSFGPQTIAGAIDLVTRPIPADEAGAIDLAAGAYGYGKLHGYYGASTARSGYVLEGVHLRSSGFKELDGGGDTGFAKNEWMWKGRYLLSTDPRATQSLGLKLGYSDEDSRESYLGLTDADLRATPLRRYAASRFDRMQYHRTQIVATYHARFAEAFTIDAAFYRHDLARTWRKFNRIGLPTRAAYDVLANATSPMNEFSLCVLEGMCDTPSDPVSAQRQDTIYIGPNQRSFVSEGAQVVAGWQGRSGVVEHRVEAGVRYHYDRIDLLHTEEGFLMRGGALIRDDGPTITTANSRAWVHALAINLTDAATWGPVTVTPGARLELIDTWKRDRLSGVLVQGVPQRVFIPGIGIYGALTETLGLLAGAYRGFSPGVPSTTDRVRPELAVNYEAGVRLSRSRLRAEAIGFFNDYQNLTSVCTIAMCGPRQEDIQSNAGRAHIYGAELFARAEPVVRPGYVIPIMAAYTYTRTELLEANDLQDPTLRNAVAGDELPYVPRHLAAATVAFETPRASLAVAGSYISAMREQAGQGPATPTEPLTDPSLIFDVTAKVAITQSGQFYLNVRNVFDEADIVSRRPFGARPVAPRWVQVGLKWNL